MIGRICCQSAQPRRNSVLLSVLRLGWVRVRDMTYETWKLADTTLLNVRAHLKDRGVWAHEKVKVIENAEKVTLLIDASKLLSGDTAGKLADLKSRILRAKLQLTAGVAIFPAPFVSTTVCQDGRVFVPTGNPVVCTHDGEGEIDLSRERRKAARESRNARSRMAVDLSRIPLKTIRRRAAGGRRLRSRRCR